MKNIKFKKYSEFAKNYALVLCNNISEIDYSIYRNVVAGELCDGCGYKKEIFQYYIIGICEYEIKYVKAHYPDVVISYSDMLDVYILLVDHCGTSWDYVNTTYKP